MEEDDSMKKTLCSHVNPPSSPSSFSSHSKEESSWTMYFDDFLAAEAREEEDYRSPCLSENPSMISDASSCKSPVTAKNMERFKDLIFRKRKAKSALDDDSLEDTASSPVNSPKVKDLNKLGTTQLKEEEKRGNIDDREKAGDYGNYEEMRKEKMNGCEDVDKPKGSSELNKRGLCLVPLSTIQHFLG